MQWNRVWAVEMFSVNTADGGDFSEILPACNQKLKFQLITAPLAPAKRSCRHKNWAQFNICICAKKSPRRIFRLKIATCIQINLSKWKISAAEITSRRNVETGDGTNWATIIEENCRSVNPDTEKWILKAEAISIFVFRTVSQVAELWTTSKHLVLEAIRCADVCRLLSTQHSPKK